MILYRLLRSDEDPSQDLHAKDPLSPTSVEKHVTYGSHGISSRYISCSKSLKAIEKFASMSKTSPKRLVIIDTRTRWSSIHAIDLTDAHILEKYISPENSKGRRYAEIYQEVLIERYIPKENIICDRVLRQPVSNPQRRKFPYHKRR